LIGAFITTYERGAEMLNFGAFIAFMGVNAAAYVHYYQRAKEKKIQNLLMPAVGFFFCGWIWWNLSPPAKIAGSIWLALGIAYGAWKTSGFRKQMSFEVPPEE
jgi:putrescine importer